MKENNNHRKQEKNLITKWTNEVNSFQDSKSKWLIIHGKTSNILSHQVSTNQSTLVVYLIPISMAIIKKKDDNRRWGEYGQRVHMTSGNVRQCSCGGKSTEFGQETKNRAIIYPA